MIFFLDFSGCDFIFWGFLKVKVEFLDACIQFTDCNGLNNPSFARNRVTSRKTLDFNFKI